MVVRSVFIALFVAIGASVAGAGGAAAQISPDAAKQFIQSMGDQAIEVLQQKDATLEQREDRFRGILKDGFAIPQIGQFVAGTYWKQASADQQREYLNVFSEWIVKTYAIRFGG